MKAGDSAPEVYERNNQIVAARARGYSTATVASQFGLSERQVRTIWSKHRVRFTEPAGEDALEALDLVVARIEQLIEDCAHLIQTTEQDGVRLGAIRTLANLLMTHTGVLERTGLISRVALWKHAINLEEFAKTFLAVLEKHQIHDEIVDEVMTDIKKMISLREVVPVSDPRAA